MSNKLSLDAIDEMEPQRRLTKFGSKLGNESLIRSMERTGHRFYLVTHTETEEKFLVSFLVSPKLSLSEKQGLVSTQNIFWSSAGHFNPRRMVHVHTNAETFKVAVDIYNRTTGYRIPPPVVEKRKPVQRTELGHRLTDRVSNTNLSQEYNTLLREIMELRGSVPCVKSFNTSYFTFKLVK